MFGKIARFIVFITLCAGPVLGAEPVRPNVVVILADDLGWADLGSYGSIYHKTPNLDRLARRGLRFTSAYAACPVCSPSRAAILTGKTPARLNLTDWLPGRTDRPSQKLCRPEIIQQLPLEELTLAEALGPLGYATASIGKWHLGGPGFWPEQQGFDQNIGGSATGSPPGGYFHFKAPGLRTRTNDDYLTDRLTDEAVHFLEENRDRPFFLYLAHYAVHIPLQARPDAIAQAKQQSPGDSQQRNPIYAAMMASLDDGVGRVLDTLDRLKIADRTVVMFTSDNGGLSVREGPNTPATSNAPLRAGKGYLYEGGLRVPLIVSWPGVTAPGSVSDIPVIGPDLYPTVLAVAGAKVKPHRALDGESLVPILRGNGRLDREALFWHYPHYSNQGGKPGGALRLGNWKLIEWFETGRKELYDLGNDSGETNDLAGSKHEDVARLGKRLADWRKSVNAQMPTPNPDFDPSAR